MSETRKLSASEKGMIAWIKRGVMAVIAIVVIFSDVMFLKLMWNHFPDGWLRLLAMIGAFATGISIILLVLAKQYWFRPGEQMHAAWGFTVIEVVVSVGNVCVASGVDISYWLMISPASPLIALSGWILLIMLDQTTKRRHEQMEMEDDIAEAERQLIKAQHEAQMEIRYKAIEYNKQYMLNALQNPENQKNIALGAEQLTINAIQQLTGRYVPPQQPAQNRAAPASLAQTGNTDTLAISRKDFDALVRRVDKSPS